MKARSRNGQDVEEAGAVVSILAFAAASVLTATLFHLVEGDTGIGGIAVSAGLLFAVASISWAISAGLKRRRAGDPGHE